MAPAQMFLYHAISMLELQRRDGNSSNTTTHGSSHVISAGYSTSTSAIAAIGGIIVVAVTLFLIWYDPMSSMLSKLRTRHVQAVRLRTVPQKDR